ncbi:hypothetical protein HMPREF0877_1337 [Weissella paramesenteroides ATCC 33313]|uniref:Uncharacterized protein n=1 Tax=Weissella paramesenteroides ATCC 33313 TaxID=585506 RepID=C5RBJ1_WEIPA|nr:hypothetical protein HMPREF0877_1337 [Weissella paramesenteroides ATCC 33313]
MIISILNNFLDLVVKFNEFVAGALRTRKIQVTDFSFTYVS